MLFLGKGNEGYVFESDSLVIKYIKNKLTIPENILSFLKEKILNNKNIFGIRRITDILETDSELLFLSPNEHCKPYFGGCEQKVLQILADAYNNEYVYTNFKPSNIMYSADGMLKIIDVGRDIVPFTNRYFKNMVERAFLTTHYTNLPNLSEVMSLLHTKNRVIDEAALDCYLQKLMNIIG